MAYVKNTWQSGDTITSEKLNHLEEGVYEAATPSGGNVFVATYSSSDGVTFTCDKEFQAIIDAVNEGKMVVAKTGYDNLTYVLSFCGGEYGEDVANPYLDYSMLVMQPNNTAAFMAIKHGFTAGNELITMSQATIQLTT